jgi:hypothetical protein
MGVRTRDAPGLAKGLEADMDTGELSIVGLGLGGRC